MIANCARCGFKLTWFNCKLVCQNFFCERDEKERLKRDATESPSRSRGEAPTGGALIGYRHNPCRKCGEHVPTPGATICLTCLCQALDDAGVVLKIKDSGAAGNLAASAVESVDRPQPAAPITTYPSGIREFTAPDGATFGRF